MSDDKKDIFDSATVIMTNPNAVKQQAKATLPSAAPSKVHISPPLPAAQNNTFEDAQTFTDIGKLDDAGTNTGTLTEELVRKKFKITEHPKILVAAIMLVLIGAVWLMLPKSDQVTPPPQVVAEPVAPVVPKTPPPQPIVQSGPKGTRYPATGDFIGELERGMQKAATK